MYIFASNIIHDKYIFLSCTKFVNFIKYKRFLIYKIIKICLLNFMEVTKHVLIVNFFIIIRY